MKSPRKRAAAIAVDTLLEGIAPVIVRKPAGAVLPPNPRVLVIRCDYIGDAAMATAVIGPIREALGASRLDVLAAPWAASLFKEHPSVDDVITIATPWWLALRGAPVRERLRAWRSLIPTIRRIKDQRYDIGIDLRGDLRQIFFFLVLGGCKERVSSDRTGGVGLLTRVVPYTEGTHEIQNNLAIAKLVGVGEKLTVEPPRLPDLPATAKDAIESVSGPLGYVTLSVRGTARSRGWPAPHAAAFAQGAAELGLGTVYVGGPGERDIAEEISRLSSVQIANLAGQLSLLESLTVFAGAKAAVAIDSGPLHLASLAGTSVIGLFGPADPVNSGPWAARSEVVAARAPCGCVQPNCDFTESGPGACMIEIQPSAVLEALTRLVGTNAPR